MTEPAGAGRRALVALSRKLSAGQLDSAFSALAGFVASAIAVRTLDLVDLGVYSILFLAFGVASQLPTHLVLSPAEIVTSHRAVTERFPALQWSLRRAAPIAVLAASSVSLGALPFAGSVDLGALTPLVITAVAFTAVSPVQDHVRRVLHGAEKSMRAAMVSGVNLIATVLAALALHRVGDLWVPFGCMAIGNGVSIVAGVYGAQREPATGPTLRELMGIGRWLIVVGTANAVGKYLAASIVGWIAGPASVGFAEAARLVARPSEVFAVGMHAVVGPRSMVAAASHDMVEVHRLRRGFMVGVLTVSILYGFLASLPVSWNPLFQLFPSAYSVPGLVVAVLAAQLIANLLGPYQGQLMGERKETTMARIELFAQAGRLVSSLGATWIGAFAIPVGHGVAQGYKLAGYAKAAGSRPDSIEPRHLRPH